MKASKYNYAVTEEDGSVIMYNGMSGALCVLNEPLYELYGRLASPMGTPDISNPETEAFVKNMRKGGYFIDDGTDEIERIKRISEPSVLMIKISV